MQLREVHLWVGLLASILIFMEAVTGILLIHTNWLSFDKKITYFEQTEPYYTDDVNIVEALERLRLRAAFPIEEVRLVMNHTLGDGHHGTAGDYKVRLKDANETLYVMDTKGNLICKEVNVANNWVRNFHYGELNNMDISWLIDIAAIVIIFLTISGIILSVRELRLKNKIRK